MSEADRPARRTPRPWRVTALGSFVIAGALFVTTALNAGGLDLREASVTDLDHVVRQERDRVDGLQQQVSAAQAEITRLGRRVDDTQVERLQARVATLKGPAGFEKVTGPGVRVVLDDAPMSEVLKVREAGDVPEDALVIHQQDIQAVVNALFAGGAEAVSVKNQRIISTTGIKCVGNTVILHGLPYSPPYDIAAIGDTTQMLSSLDQNEYVNGILAAAARYKLGYDVETDDSLTIPAFKGIPLLKYAAQAPADVTR